QLIVIVSLLQLTAICYACLMSGLTLKIWKEAYGARYLPADALVFYYGFLAFVCIPLIYSGCTAYLSFKASFRIPGWIQTGVGLLIATSFILSGCKILMQLFAS